MKMKIEIPRNTIALAIDVEGTGNPDVAYRYNPFENKVIPVRQLVVNPVSAAFGRWRQTAFFTIAKNAQVMISEKSKTNTKRMWVVLDNMTFKEIWRSEMGPIEPGQIQVEPKPEVKLTEVEEVADENQVG